MQRALRLVTGLVVLAGGVMVGLFGLLALLWQGEFGGGDTYVQLWGRQVDAHLFGTVALVIGIAGVVVSVLLFRRRRASP